METEIFFIPAWSEETLLFDLNLHNKNSLIVLKNSENAGVNLAEKAYHCIVYTPMGITDCLKPTVISLVSIYEHLKNIVNHAFA